MNRFLVAALWLASIGLMLGPAQAETLYAYDAAKTGAVTFGPTRAPANGVTARSIEYLSATGNKVTGEIVAGSATTPQPGVLFVHWFGDPKTTNHTQFEKDAIALAARGATSILVDAMWSQPKWFERMGHSAEGDTKETVAQVVDLRTALDVLLAQRNVDASRIAFVGHDFGAMLGAFMASADSRPQYFAYLAGNPSLSKWYTLGKKDPGGQYLAAMAKFDVLEGLRASKAKGVLLQFSAHDKYVTAEEAIAFLNAAPLPRGAFFYDADHDLDTPQAFQDRQAWLISQLFGNTTR
jgi:dienelactone hydrolase